MTLKIINIISFVVAIISLCALGSISTKAFAFGSLLTISTIIHALIETSNIFKEKDRWEKISYTI